MAQARLHPPDFKQSTKNQFIKQIGAPSELIFPLLQHTGAPCQPCVSVGDKVKTATLIADSKAFLSAPIHSSVSGEVKSIAAKPHPVLGQYRAIVIASDGQDTLDANVKDRKNAASLSEDEIRKVIRSCGIVGLGGGAFPTHVKLTPLKEKPIDTFILNGAECEPYLSADHRLMLERSQEVLEGMKLAMKALGINRGFVAIEGNKPDAISVFKRLCSGNEIKVIAIKSFYPQGAERQLIKTILRREVPLGGLPFDVGVVVHNVATCLAIFEAVCKNKPLYERVITVGGKIVKNPANLKVRIGTKVKDVIEFVGGLTEEPGKVILGGPMMGIAQYTLEAPVIKGTSGIIVFSKEQAQERFSQSCIRCAKCIQACPMGLNPSQICQAVEKGRFDLAKEYHVLDCIECGICSYACPGNRDVVGLVKLAKQRLKK